MKADRVALVHGVPRAQEALAKRIGEELGLQAEIPAVGDTIEL
jgi:predicted metal-dependent RNase